MFVQVNIDHLLVIQIYGLLSPCHLLIPVKHDFKRTRPMKLMRLNLLHCLCLMNSPINDISFVLYFIAQFRPAVAMSWVLNMLESISKEV